MPHLAIGLRITEEALVTLLRALEAGLRNLRIVRIINASSTCAGSRMFIYKKSMIDNVDMEIEQTEFLALLEGNSLGPF